MILLGAAASRLSWTIHRLWEPIPAILVTQLWPIDKTDLAPIRLVHFLALAIIVVRFVPADARFLRSRLVQPIIRCGQQSLQVFCLGILLSVLGFFVFAEWSDSLTAQLTVNMAGVALMIGAGALITWYRNIDRDKAAAGRDAYRAARIGG
jgi:prepilin signal peptidase PulO-like enzyme (type II secretory pathway)